MENETFKAFMIGLTVGALIVAILAITFKESDEDTSTIIETNQKNIMEQPAPKAPSDAAAYGHKPMTELNMGRSFYYNGSICTKPNLPPVVIGTTGYRSFGFMLSEVTTGYYTTTDPNPPPPLR